MYLDCYTLKDSADGRIVCKTWCLMVDYPSEFKITDMFSSKSTKAHQHGKLDPRKISHVHSVHAKKVVDMNTTFRYG
jgi:hypothetical protein